MLTSLTATPVNDADGYELGTYEYFAHNGGGWSLTNHYGQSFETMRFDATEAEAEARVRQAYTIFAELNPARAAAHRERELRRDAVRKAPVDVAIEAQLAAMSGNPTHIEVSPGTACDLIALDVTTIGGYRVLVDSSLPIPWRIETEEQA